MKIAVLSGKGGTGKTMVSVNLASVSGYAAYVDCDVEEPNGHLFFRPTNQEEESIMVRSPRVNDDLCSGCRKCVEFCRFNALAYVGGKLLIFDDLCHSCGGCLLVCPEKALTEVKKPMGKVQVGSSAGVEVLTGILNLGEASGIPIINRLLEKARNLEDQGREIFVDCPPGTACIVMESIQDADYCLLVAEPSTFGAHNMAMVHELVTLFKKPFGVVLNKEMGAENPSRDYCLEKNLPVLGEIPFDNRLGSLNSMGTIAARAQDNYRQLFDSLLETIRKEVGHEKITHPQW